MPCGCRKARLPAAKPERWASLVDKPYRNDSGEILRARNPRIVLQPDEVVVLNADMISHSIRTWIRSGALVLETT
jgi:hypothetical protein